VGRGRRNPRFAPYLLLRPSEEAPGYQDVMFKKSLLSCQFVEMSVTGGGAGGLDARPMEPVFSYASLSLNSQMQMMQVHICCTALVPESQSEHVY